MCTDYGWSNVDYCSSHAVGYHPSLPPSYDSNRLQFAFAHVFHQSGYKLSVLSDRTIAACWSIIWRCCEGVSDCFWIRAKP